MGLTTALAIGATVAGSALSASSNRRAARTASDTSLQVAQQNNALARENRDMLLQRTDPFVNSGLQANALLNDFYGITPPQAAQPQPNALSQFQGPNPDTSGFQTYPTSIMGAPFAGNNNPALRDENPVTSSNAWWATANDGFPGMPGLIGGYGGGTFDIGSDGGMIQRTPAYGQVTSTQGGVTAPNSADAFRRYIENSDYGFQWGEGANAVNSGYAGAGTLQSGAAMRALEDYRQNLQSTYRNQWAAGVGNQQSAGLNALGAAAGVSTNAVNQISANNNAAGTAAANAALARGANNPWANALGTLGGTILGGGFGR